MAETAMFPVDKMVEQPLGRPLPSHSTDKPAVVREPVFVACGLSKIYRMGDVEVHALRSVDLEL